MIRALKLGAVLLPLVIAAVMFAAWLVASQQLAARVYSVGPIPPDLDGHEVRFESETGNRISGWLFPGSLDVGIVLMHGKDGDRRSMTSRARFLAAAGYSVLTFDFQANGESPGEQTTYGYRESLDAYAAVEFLRGDVGLRRIGVLGFSLGGAAALLGPQGPLEVDALVLEAVYSTIEEATANRIRLVLGPYSGWLHQLFTWQIRHRLGIEPEDLRPIERIGMFQAPVLVIVGGDDRRTTLAQSLRLAEAANEPKDLWVITSARHENFHAHSPDEYERRVLAFFSRHLGS